jgi:hypothetical protein
MRKGYILLLILIVLIPALGNTQSIIAPKFANKNELSVSVETKDASEQGKNDAFVKLKISGGLAPYTIHCFSPYSLPTQTTGNELKLEKIQSGDYLFVIQDKSGKSVVKEVNLSNLK